MIVGLWVWHKGKQYFSVVLIASHLNALQYGNTLYTYVISMSQIVLCFLHSTSVLSHYTGVVLTLSINLTATWLWTALFSSFWKEITGTTLYTTTIVWERKGERDRERGRGEWSWGREKHKVGEGQGEREWDGHKDIVNEERDQFIGCMFWVTKNALHFGLLRTRCILWNRNK